jgi:hypothetical protein
MSNGNHCCVSDFAPRSDAPLNQTSMILRIPSVTHLRQKQYQKEYFEPCHGWNRVCVLAKWRRNSPITLSE